MTHRSCSPRKEIYVDVVTEEKSVGCVHVELLSADPERVAKIQLYNTDQSCTHMHTHACRHTHARARTHTHVHTDIKHTER